jgi:outer membrane immunogenic protein
MLRRILLASAGAMALAGPALAADLPYRGPPPVYVPPPPIYTWTGAYAGLNAGYTWSNSNNVTTRTGVVFGNPILGGSTVAAVTSAALATGNLPAKIDGFIGGGQFGYNYQFGNSFVTGLELDFQGVASSNSRTTRFSSAPIPGFFPIALNSVLSSSRSLGYLGTVRGRIGFLITPTWLIYGTGGLAYGGASTSTDIRQQFANTAAVPNAFASAGRFSHALAGWTAGGGVEWLFYPNWSLKVEYLYYDLGRVTYNLSPLTSFNFAGAPFTGGAPVSSTRFNGNIVRAGINYHFNWGYPPAPVVAKY